MRRKEIIQKAAGVVVLAMLAGISGCMRDNVDTSAPDLQGEGLVIEMSVPAFEIFKTTSRSIEDGKGEAVVEELDLLIFDKTADARLIRSVKLTEFTQSPSGPGYKVSAKLNEVEEQDAGSVIIVANASVNVDDALSAAGANAKKQEILAALTFSTLPDGQGTYKWNVSENYTPIPMYGESVLTNGLGSNVTVAMSLSRMVARIDVENKVNASTFKLEEIYLVNYNTRGYIAPALYMTSGKGPGYPYDTNTDPMVPNPSGKQPGTKAASMLYPYSQPAGAAGPNLMGTIYTYEAVKNTTAKNDEGTCLILKGKYLGVEYYYRVDFTLKNDTPGTSPTDIEYMPLYRNHKYVVRITGAGGIGYESFEAALKSTTVLSNLKTSIIVVDMAGINEMVFDGQYFMGFESRQVDMLWGISKDFNYRVSSDYEGEWKAQVLDAGSNTWLKFDNGNQTISGDDINSTGLGIRVTATSRPSPNDEYVNGKILLTAGRLRDTITVRRVPITEMFARSNVVIKPNGGSVKLTFAVTREENLSMPAYSQGVYFKWGSIIGLASAGNPYSNNAHVLFNPTGQDPAGWGKDLTGWDNIPYAHSKFNFTTPGLSGDDMDALASYNNSTGYNETTGVGDICRYISDQAGWIEGNWRLPTYAEMKMLLDETPQLGKGGDFANTTSVLNDNSDTYLYGNFNPLSGWMTGIKSSESAVSQTQMGIPPEGTRFLPAAGQRYYYMAGDVVHVGAYGYYWTSTPVDQITIWYPLLSKDGVEFNEIDRSYALPVRCIRNY